MADVPDDKGGENQGAGNDADQDSWVTPSMDRLLDDAVDERRDPNHCEQSADPVEGSGMGILALRYEKPHADQRDDDDRRVDQEDRSPGVMSQQPAGDERASREA